MEKIDRWGTVVYWIDLLAVILMSAATVSSAWCAYQAARWSGEQANSYSRAAALRSEAARETTIASRKMSIDVGMFIAYAAAYSQNDSLLSRFLVARFRPEFEPAFKAWVESKPLKNPQAPRSPFEMRQYRIAEALHAQALEDSATQRTAQARAANQTSDNYVLLTVLFAVVLFFAGIDSKLRHPSLRVAILVAAGLLFLTCVVVLGFYPIH